MRRITLLFCFVLATTLMSLEPSIPSYLKDLEELGYCIIPEVLSSEEAESLYQRVWHEFIEKAWPNCRLDDRSNWKEAFPKHDNYGIFAGPAGQIQVMWDLRQDPRIIDVFASIWNTNDLIVSMDGLCLMCPPEIREGNFVPWPHVDQRIGGQQDLTISNNPPIDFVSESSLKTEPFTIQGQFLFEESSEVDGGFYCIPKSHLRFNEFAPPIEAIYELDIPPAKKYKAGFDCLRDFFIQEKDELGNPYEMKHITAPRGSLILWDSRTVHWNQYPSSVRPYSTTPKMRMVGYLCYVPKTRQTDEVKALRLEAFEKGVSTGHNPTFPFPRYSKDRIWEGFERYLENPNYTHPTILLTEVGRSILGL